MTIKYGLKELERDFGKLTFARALKAYRLGEEISQVDMAKFLKISKQSLNDLENGRTIPSIKRAAEIAKKIGRVESVYIELAIQDQIDKAKIDLKITLVPIKKSKKAS